MATETETQTDRTAAEREAEVDYLNQEISIINPSTPFMRDNLKVIWGTFIVWIFLVFGPVTVAAIAPEAADAARIAGTPALFMMTAIGTPLGALLLAAGYAYQRDRLDEKYGIRHEQGQPTDEESATAADGGEQSEGLRDTSGHEPAGSEETGSSRTSEDKQDETRPEGVSNGGESR